jgi:DNA-directed RNA polymerase subunit P
MPQYRCGSCKRLVELDTEGPVRCPFCGYKILYKIRPAVVKKVKAR